MPLHGEAGRVRRRGRAVPVCVAVLPVLPGIVRLRAKQPRRCDGGGYLAGEVARLNSQTDQRGQDMPGSVGRDRHRLLRDNGENLVAHHGDALREDLRFGEDMRPQWEQHRFFPKGRHSRKA